MCFLDPGSSIAGRLIGTRNSFPGSHRQACEVNEVWLYCSEDAKLHVFLDVRFDIGGSVKL